MNETTRNAARKLYGWHIMKHNQPELFCWSGPIPKRFHGLLGIDQGFVFGTFDHCTIVTGSYLENAKGPVPCMPWVFPEGIAATTRDIGPMLDLLLGKPILVEVGYSEGAGTDLVGVGKWKARGIQKVPVFTIHATAKKIGDGRAFDVETTEPKLNSVFVVGGMAEDIDREAIHLRTELTGELMRHHVGKLEYRGHDTPILLRSVEGAMVSIVRASPPPKVLEDKTEAEIFEDQKLPGLFTDALRKAIVEAEAEKNEGKGEKKAPEVKSGRGRKRR